MPSAQPPGRTTVRAVRKRAWLGAGWKMNKTRQEAREYAAALRSYLAGQATWVEIFVVPPYTALDVVCDALRGGPVHVGAQNMHWSEQGAFTGEISPLMLVDVGVSLVELGHSERRAACGETDEAVNRKVLAALDHGLRPLVCVGESLAERDSGQAVVSVGRQVTTALTRVASARLGDVLLAYEPLWAIGAAGRPAEPAYANRMHQAIRAAIALGHGPDAATGVPVLYGGSVDPLNVPAFAGQPDIDGLFIGRASWDVRSFIACLQAFEETRRPAITG